MTEVNELPSGDFEFSVQVRPHEVAIESVKMLRQLKVKELVILSAMMGPLGPIPPVGTLILSNITSGKAAHNVAWRKIMEKLAEENQTLPNQE